MPYALRLAITLGVSTEIYRHFGFANGYWIPMTALLVLRPGLSDTANRAIARTIGTLAGAMLASFFLAHLAPPPPTLAFLILFFAWFSYSLNNVNYGLFTLCLTAYIVCLLALDSLPGQRCRLPPRHQHPHWRRACPHRQVIGHPLSPEALDAGHRHRRGGMKGQSLLLSFGHGRLRVLLPLGQRKHPILAFALIGYIQHPALLYFSLSAVPDRSSIEAARRRRHCIAYLSQFRGPSNLQQVFAYHCRTVESFILAAFRSLFLERLQGLFQLSAPASGARTRNSSRSSSRRCLSRRTVSVGLDLGPIVLSKHAYTE